MSEPENIEPREYCSGCYYFITYVQSCKYRRKMMTIRTLSVTIVLVMLSLGFSFASARAAPEAQNIVSTVSTLDPLLSNILNIVNTIGDYNFATADLTTLIDPSSTPAQHYGPYASATADSGTCGNNWADDTFQRHFTIFNKAGSVVVVEQFRDGSFLTPSTATPPPPDTNQSPGACNTSPGPFGNGGKVAPGVTGGLRGYFIIPIPTGVSQTSMDPHCDAVTMMSPPAEDCFTSTFMNSHFLTCSYPSDTGCHVTTFLFTYEAADQGLIEHAWKNASTDRGGNNGDIRST